MKKWVILALCFLPACAGWGRSCSTFSAENFGSDWVVVQLSAAGEVIRCWKLEGVSVVNEPNSDGIYWKSESGNLVHLSGFYNRVQVTSQRWKEAFSELGIPDGCPAKE